MDTINIYCDESCHLDYNTSEGIMGFGGIECKLSKIKEINSYIAEIKKKYNISPYQELKWSKICNTNKDLYKDIINYFFIDDDLKFRTIIITNKSELKFTKKNTKSDFYYKMLYFMLIKILNPVEKYNIYLDIKDTNSSKRIKKLESYLNNTKIDYNVKNTITKIQTIRSYESNLIQITDILLGAIVYYNRGLCSNNAKNEIIEYIKQKSQKLLNKSTLRNEPKFNIFICNARRMQLRGEDEL